MNAFPESVRLSPNAYKSLNIAAACEHASNSIVSEKIRIELLICSSLRWKLYRFIVVFFTIPIGRRRAGANR